MTGLHDLLEQAATDPIEVDVAGDLRRGHRALSRRRSHLAVGATGSLAILAAVGVSAVPRHAPEVAAQPADGSTAVAPFQTKYYDVPTPPAGWHVSHERPQYVMLTRDGTISRLDDFAGQLVVIMSDRKENYESATSVQFDGRTVYVNEMNDDATILSVRTSPGGNWLQVQYPKDVFPVHDMAAFLCGVGVEPGAEPAFG